METRAIIAVIVTLDGISGRCGRWDSVWCLRLIRNAVGGGGGEEEEEIALSALQMSKLLKEI